jgi:hypothetical protein
VYFPFESAARSAIFFGDTALCAYSLVHITMLICIYWSKISHNSFRQAQHFPGFSTSTKYASRCHAIRGLKFVYILHILYVSFLSSPYESRLDSFKPSHSFPTLCENLQSIFKCAPQTCRPPYLNPATHAYIGQDQTPSTPAAQQLDKSPSRTIS